jgi:hypothetical protein
MSETEKRPKKAKKAKESTFFVSPLLSINGHWPEEVNEKKKKKFL